MANLSESILKVLEEISTKTNPISIFLYGSRARTDFIKTSDYEVGILYKSDKKVSRSDLAKMHNITELRIYPFDYDEFINNNLDTPFPKAVYMRGLIAKAITLYGNKIVEEMNPPKIYTIDLLEEAVFQISRAYTAILSEREGDIVNAKAGFVKSILYGTLALIIFKLQKFPVGYDEIIKLSNNLILDDEYKSLIKYAYEVRNGKDLEASMLYKSMSYINKEIITPIKFDLKSGNKIVI